MRIQYTCGNAVLARNVNDINLEMASSDMSEIVNEIDRLNGNKNKAHNISTRDTIDILDNCAKLWLNRDYSKKHIEVLSHILNQSEALITYELENSMQMLLKDNLEKTIKEELKDLDILDKWIETSYGEVHRQPRGVVFHNISGNAFVVVPMSISMGLLSKNCNLVKVSADEPYFANAFYESLCMIDQGIKERLSVVYFNSECSNIYETIVKSVDCVIHWGGEYSGRIMGELCAKYNKHLILHGAKISFEVIDEAEDINLLSEGVARDVICWEQKACLSPRIIFVNRKINTSLFAERIGEQLKKLTLMIPKAYLNPWSSIKMLQDRQYCMIKYGVKEKQDIQVHSSYNADYTVILNSRMPDKQDIDKCFNRFVFVCPYSDNNEVLEYANNNLKQYLQTMGYSGENQEFLEKMSLLGVSIITRPGEMPMHYPGTSHDGIHNLKEMTFVASKQL